MLMPCFLWCCLHVGLKSIIKSFCRGPWTILTTFSFIIEMSFSMVRSVDQRVFLVHTGSGVWFSPTSLHSSTGWIVLTWTHGLLCFPKYRMVFWRVYNEGVKFFNETKTSHSQHACLTLHFNFSSNIWTEDLCKAHSCCLSRHRCLLLSDAFPSARSPSITSQDPPLLLIVQYTAGCTATLWPCHPRDEQRRMPVQCATHQWSHQANFFQYIT